VNFCQFRHRKTEKKKLFSSLTFLASSIAHNHETKLKIPKISEKTVIVVSG
jgi:hypothetical protein